MTTRTRRIAIAAAVDLVLVVIFCIIGRRSHAEGLSLGGIVDTAWPFLGGLVVGWLVTYALYRDKFDPMLVLPTGVLVWVLTVAGGMTFRVLGGQGTEFGFVVVASIVLGLFLIGWRAVARRFVRPLARTGSS